VWVRGVIAAAWAVGIGVASLVVLALVVWAADSSSIASASGAMRFAAQLWLLAHRTPMRITGGALTIPPLGLTLVLGLLLARAAAIVARASNCTDGRDVGIVIAAVTAPYAVLATILAALTQSATLHPSVGAALVCAVVVGGVAATLGAARGSGLALPLWRSLPAAGRGSIEAAAAAGGVLACAAAVLAIGSLLAHGSQFGNLVGTYHGGPGEFAMVLLSVLMLPNAICFAAGYIAGPGFAIGAGTSVGYGGVHLGALPAFPLLAAVPGGRAPWQVTAVFIAALVLAGVAAGWRVARLTELSLPERARAALSGGALLGVVVAAVVGFAGGPAGPGRLSAVGPSPWQVGLALAAEVSVLGVLVVLAKTWVGLARGRLAQR
jgi:hypothetical protein